MIPQSNMQRAVCAMALFFTVFSFTSGYNSNYYCSVNLCPHGGQNVGCQPPPAAGGHHCYGKSATSVPMTASLQAHILHLHNHYRSLVASGRQAPFAPATRMYTLVWDDELAAQAGHNARACRFAHDQCRNTPDFQQSGQNLALFTFYGSTYTVEDIVTHFLASWWNEHQYTKPSYIQAFPRSQLKAIGHFTMLISDGTWKVGCALQYWTERAATKVYLVCNYSYNNIIGRKVYTAGPAASQCQAGPNHDYPGLCLT